jgi:hypothetical protein
MGLLSLGSTLVVTKRFNAAEAINRYKSHALPLVPPIMAALVEAAKPVALLLDSFGAGVEWCSATKREIDSGLREDVSPCRFHSGPPSLHSFIHAAIEVGAGAFCFDQ